MPRCALCHLDRTLRRSHILPELVHKPLYDSKHQFKVIGQGRTRAEIKQKGDRERLLCDDCEGILQEFEDYFARWWYRGAVPEVIPPGGWFTLQGYDYRRVKLFVLSLVWRASVAKGALFSDADLGPAHEERIRDLLFRGDPGAPDDYRIYAGLIIDPGTRHLWDNFLLLPIRFKLPGTRLHAYRIGFGSAAWTVVISKHATPPGVRDFLDPSGRMSLPVIPWQDFARDSGFLESTSTLRELRGGVGAKGADTRSRPPSGAPQRGRDS